MNNTKMYDQFSQHYDRFVNWEERIAVEIPFLISELRASKSPKDDLTILDAACGTGQHLIALANHGFTCMGADFSPGMVKIAQKNAKKAGQSLIFKQAGFGQIEDTFGKDGFDGLICLGNSLPHILDEGTLLNTLADFHAVMRTGSKLILQNRNFDKVLMEQSRFMSPQTYKEDNHTWIFNRFYDFDDDERITFNIQLLESEDCKNFHQTLFSTQLWPIRKETLNKTLLRAGFQRTKLFGDLTGSVFDIKDSPNLVVTAIA